jgi:hypothetical protein
LLQITRNVPERFGTMDLDSEIRNHSNNNLNVLYQAFKNIEAMYNRTKSLNIHSILKSSNLNVLSIQLSPEPVIVWIDAATFCYQGC